ncbi:MAG: hypothetical protein ACOC0R_00570 [Mariniphaga sp.]
MEITVEISYFPLLENHQQPVNDFIGALNKSEKVKVEAGLMSSLLTGSFEDIMKLLHLEMKPFMEKYPSVFTVKVSNSCSVCKTD